MGSPESSDRSHNRTSTLIAGISVGALGGAALAGWVLQVEALKAIVPGSGVIAPNLAVGMFLCGGALALLSRKTLPRAAQICAAAMSATVIIMALLVLSEYLFGWKLGIEEWPVGITGRLGVLHPERVTPATAVSFLVLSIILFAFHSIQTRLGLSIAAGLSGAHAVIAVIALAAPSLQMFFGSGGNYSALDITGIPGAIGFMLLGSGLFALLRRKGALRWSIDPVTTSAFGFGILLLLIAAGAAISFTTQMLETTKSLTHRQEILKKTQEIMTAMLELESDERAYIITGRVHLQTRRESAKARLDEVLLQVHKLTSYDPVQQRSLDQLEPLIAQRIDLEEKAIRLRREGAFSEAAQMVVAGNGLKLSGDISALLRRMQDAEDDSLAYDQKRAATATKTAFMVLPVGVLLSLIILAVGLLLLNSGIGEQKEAESGLRVAEEKYRSIFEHTNEGIFQNTLEGAFISANPALARILGYESPQQLIDDRIDVQRQGYVDPAQREEFKRILAQHGAVQGFEYQVQRKDGPPIWVSESAHLVCDAEARPLYYEGSVQDITERKQSEEALKQSEKRYRSLFEANPLPMWIYDLETLSFLEVNDTAIAHYGYGREEFLSMTIADIRPATEKQALRANVAEVGGGVVDNAGVWKHQKKDGSLIDVEITSHSLDYKERRARLVLAFDVTKRQRADAEQQVISDIVQGVTTTTNLDELLELAWRSIGKLLYAENCFVGLHNADTDLIHFEFWVDKCDSVPPPQPISNGFTRSSYVLRTGQPLLLTTELKARLFDQGKVAASGSDSASWLGVPLRTPTRTIGVLAVQHYEKEGVYNQHDLEFLSLVGDQIALAIERKQADETLRESEQRLALAKEAAHIGIWDWDVVTNDLVWDTQMYELYGIRAEDFTGAYSAWQKGLHADDRVRAEGEIRAAVEGANGFHTEFRVVWPNGEVRHIEAHAVAHHAHDGSTTRMIGVNSDITEKIRAAHELEDTHKQLLESSRQAGMAEVATSVLHNVGNVLNSVNVSCSVISDRVRKSPIGSVAKTAALLQEHTHDLGPFFNADPVGRKLPNFLGKLATQLSNEQTAIVAELHLLTQNIEHIKDIVSVQQSHANNVGGVRETLPCEGLMEDALRINEGSLKRHHIAVLREYSEAPPISLEKHKVLQILVNLVRNAKQALTESGRSDKQLTVQIGRNNGDVSVSVNDNGIGIAPENLTRIFAHGFTTRKDGHGFGLHSGVLAAQQMGGKLTVHSDGLGAGTTFTLKLPVAGSGNN